MTQNDAHSQDEFLAEAAGGLPSADLPSDIENEINAALSDVNLMDLAFREAELAPMPDTDATEGAQSDEVRRGTVVAIQRDDLLIDLGGKSTGVLPVKQLGDEKIPAVGQTIEVVVTGYNEDEGLVLLSRQGAVTAATWATIEKGQTVDGRVTGHNKGGLELTVDGIDAFMPISQIDLSRIESDDLPAYQTQKLLCEVTEVRRSEQTLIVSRRNILLKQQAEQREATIASLVEGTRVTGTVKTIMPYGAFVDIGGVDGLLHIGDMGHARIDDPRKVVTQGQRLELMVLKIDREDKKIALGLKQTLTDPWQDAENKWPADSVVSGRITKLMDFGAFLELEAGVEGLIPISEMTFEKRINHPREVVSENEVVKVRVLNVDTQRRRISLSLKRVGEDPWVGASVRWAVNSAVEGKVIRITDFGAFVELAPGVDGLVHISEISEGRVHSVKEALQEGQIIQAKILTVDEDRRRISLSIKQLTALAESTMVDSTSTEQDKQKRKRKKPLRGGLD